MNRYNNNISIREASDYLKHELNRDDDVYITDMNLITYIDMNLERIGVINRNTRTYIINNIVNGISMIRFSILINNNIEY